MQNPKDLMQEMFEAAVRAAMPKFCLAGHLPPPPIGRTIVIGAGKASGAMAQALEEQWPGGAGSLSGLVVTRYGHAVPTSNIEVVEASHPVPDAAGLDAARRILDLVSDLTEDDLVIALISGGGSALLSLPAAGLTLADKQAVNKALLHSGAAIGDMNIVRKHLSAIKGGRLAAASYPAKMVTLAISDVPGDEPGDIASGPTVGDPTSALDAMAVIKDFGINLPAAVQAHLQSAAAETPSPDDELLSRAEFRLIAAPQMALEAAADLARKAGYTPIILGDSLEGEARELGTVMAGIAAQVIKHGQPVGGPAVLLSGGEATVTIKNPNGRGGPNTEFLLGLARALEGNSFVHAIACDTDGVDGSEDNAGAMIAPDTLARARNQGLDIVDAQLRNDAWGFFDALGDLVVPGPTLTNVNDFRAVVITAGGDD